jgi:hypothetical protein
MCFCLNSVFYHGCTTHYLLKQDHASQNDVDAGAASAINCFLSSGGGGGNALVAMPAGEARDPCGDGGGSTGGCRWG